VTEIEGTYKPEGAYEQALMDAGRFSVFGDRVLILRDRSADRTDGGILLPDESRVPPDTGRVVGKGTDTHRVGLGDRVIFGHYTGTELPLGKSILVLVVEDDLLGKVI